MLQTIEPGAEMRLLTDAEIPNVRGGVTMTLSELGMVFLTTTIAYAAFGLWDWLFG